MDREHRARPELLWDAFIAPNQSDPHLPPDGKFAGGPAAAGAQEIENTVRYLGIEVDDALAIAEQVDV
jgi:hypothetical protein